MTDKEVDDQARWIEESEAFKELKERVRKCEQENKRLRSLIAMLIDQGRV